MKILNLFAGIGGNRRSWSEHDVTAVEINRDLARVYSNFYPDDLVIVEDVISFLNRNPLNKFDFIWASPPCTTHSCMRNANSPEVPDMTGIYGVRQHLEDVFKGYYIIENTQPRYIPLIKPSVILDRHYIWSNFFIPGKTFSSREKIYTDLKNKELLKYHNIPNFKLKDSSLRKDQILRNCCHYSIGEYILDCLNKKPNLLKFSEEKISVEEN